MRLPPFAANRRPSPCHGSGIQLWMPEVGGRVDWHAEDHEETMLAPGAVVEAGDRPDPGPGADRDGRADPGAGPVPGGRPVSSASPSSATATAKSRSLVNRGLCARRLPGRRQAPIVLLLRLGRRLPCAVLTQRMPRSLSLEGRCKLPLRGGSASHARTMALISLALACGCSRRIRCR